MLTQCRTVGGKHESECCGKVEIRTRKNVLAVLYIYSHLLKAFLGEYLLTLDLKRGDLNFCVQSPQIFFSFLFSLSFFLLFYSGGGDEVLETCPCNLGYHDQARLRLSYMADSQQMGTQFLHSRYPLRARGVR